MRIWRALVLGLAVLPIAALRAEEAAPDAFLKTVALAPVAKLAAMLTQHPNLATASDRFGFQPIHVLDYRDFDAKLGLLIDHGADINAQNADGNALIHILIDAEFLPAVLLAGANINLRNRRGESPLMVFAAEAEGEDMVAALLNAGADATLRDDAGMSLLGRLRRDGVHVAIIERLKAASAPP